MNNIDIDTTDALDTQRKRIRYRSWHRGCKETDILLGHFCDAHVDGYSEAELDAFEVLLDEEDDGIYKWLTGKQPVPERLADNPVLQGLLHYTPPALRQA